MSYKWLIAIGVTAVIFAGVAKEVSVSPRAPPCRR